MDNTYMEIQGRIQNGVVVFESAVPLPEGAAVSIVYPAHVDQRQAVEKKRVQLPLFPCDQPGSIDLATRKIAEILNAEDSAPRH